MSLLEEDPFQVSNKLEFTRSACVWFKTSANGPMAKLSSCFLASTLEKLFSGLN